MALLQLNEGDPVKELCNNLLRVRMEKHCNVPWWVSIPGPATSESVSLRGLRKARGDTSMKRCV